MPSSRNNDSKASKTEKAPAASAPSASASAPAVIVPPAPVQRIVPVAPAPPVVDPRSLFAGQPRSKKNLAAVIAYLDPEHAAKYVKRDITKDGIAETFCNQFVADACELLDAPLPKNLLARQQLLWLESPDGAAGRWFRCASAAEAGAHADLGRPVIVGWINPDAKKSSHVAILRGPGLIAQAGNRNYNDTPLGNGFGIREVSYHSHL